MKELDNFVAKMKERNISRATLIADTPMRLKTPTVEVDGPVMSTAKIEALVREAAPKNFAASFAQNGHYKFAYYTNRDIYDIAVMHNAGALQVSITKAPSNIRMQSRGENIAFAEMPKSMLLKAGVAIFVVGLGATWMFVAMAHQMGAFLPAIIVACPVVAFMGLDMAIFQEQFSGGLADMGGHSKVMLGLGAVAGFAVYGLLKMGYI